VTYTTRAPRSGEKDGIDYHFVTNERFQQLVDDGAFLEDKEVHGNRYASPLRDTQQLIAEGKIAVLKIDVQGAITVIPEQPEAITVFVMPPSIDELDRRIRGRQTDSDEAIALRLKNALWEVSQAHLYRYRVVNDAVDRAVDELEDIVGRKD
jgi:guanylate kinase